MIDKDKFESESIANFLNRIVNNVEIYLTNDDADKNYYFLNILNADLGVLLSNVYKTEVEKYLSENTHHKLYNVFADVQADIKNIEDNDPFINLNDRLQKIFDNHYVKLLEKRKKRKNDEV